MECLIGFWMLAAILAGTSLSILWVERTCRESERAMEWVDEQYRLIDQEFNKGSDNPVWGLDYEWRGLGPISWREARRMVADHRKFKEQYAAKQAARN